MGNNCTEKTCPTCGHTAKAWWQPLSRSLVRCLFKFGQAIKTKGINRIHLQRDIELSKSEYTNFNKLKFFGLVAKDKERGYWVLTTRGLQFLQNKIAVPVKVLTFEDIKIDEVAKCKTISQYSRDQFGFDQYYNFEIIDGKVCNGAWQKPAEQLNNNATLL